MKPNNFQIVVDDLNNLIDGTEEIYNKEYLIHSLVSHIMAQTGLPEKYITGIVQSFYDGYHL